MHYLEKEEKTEKKAEESSSHLLCGVSKLGTLSIISDTVLSNLLKVNKKLFSAKIVVSLTSL